MKAASGLARVTLLVPEHLIEANSLVKDVEKIVSVERDEGGPRAVRLASTVPEPLTLMNSPGVFLPTAS